MAATLLSLTLASPEADADAAPDGKRPAPLTYVTLGGADLAKFGLTPSPQSHPVSRNDRRIPEVTGFSNLGARALSARAIPLPEADTLAARNFFAGRFGCIQTENDARLFNPGIILVKFRNAGHVAALRVEPLRELDAMRAVRQRGDVEFAELDSFERRQFNPNDALLINQWHHAVIGSFQAWDHSLGQPFVRVAIVDTPFQMDHPDLASHTDPGWDVVNGGPVPSSSGMDHSTLCAGLAAAVIGNQHFAAPGWKIFSTTTGSSYGYGSGTSYSTAIFCGVLAVLFSINPTLSPDEVIELLKNSAADLGPPGWDPYYGWGRINFAAAAAAADASRPVIASLQLSNGTAVVTVTNQPALSFALGKTPALGAATWEIVTNVVLSTHAGVLTLTDPAPGTGGNFYRVEARVP